MEIHLHCAHHWFSLISTKYEEREKYGEYTTANYQGVGKVCQNRQRNTKAEKVRPI